MDENDSSELLDPELRGRSTGSMVTNFVLGITFSHETQEKTRNPSYSRRSP